MTNNISSSDMSNRCRLCGKSNLSVLEYKHTGFCINCYIKNLENLKDEWEDLANDWKNAYDRLKNKYEPEIIAPSTINNKLENKLNKAIEALEFIADEIACSGLSYLLEYINKTIKELR